MKAPLLIGVGIAVISLILPSVAESAPVASTIVANALQTTVAAVTGQLQTLAIQWLSVFMLAQFLITNLGLLKSGADIEAVWGKLVGSLMWFGFCFYLVDNGPDFIKKVGGQIFMEAGTISGAPGIFSAGNLFDWGLRLSQVLMTSVNKADGDGWFPTLDFLPSLLTFVSCLIILAVSALIGFKIFVIKIELMITVMMAPLSFSFMALSSLKDQGMAPFKSLISLIYRVMILAVIVSAMEKVGTSLEAAFKAVGAGPSDTVWQPVFASLMVYALFGYLAWKSDSMAANLASGSTSLGTGDAATAAAAGAAAAAAVATGGAAAVGGGAKAVQAMGDFMKGIGGGGGAIKNASTQGAGGSTSGTAPARPAALSAGGGFATSKSGAPMKESNAGKNHAGAMSARRTDVGGGRAESHQTQTPYGGDAQAAVPFGASGTSDNPSTPDSGSIAAGQSHVGPALQGGTGRAPVRGPVGNGGSSSKPLVTAPVARAPAGGATSSSAPASGGRRAPVRPAPANPSAPAVAAASGVPLGSEVPGGTGSAAHAGIAGAVSPLEQKVDKLLENAMHAPKRQRPTLSDRLGKLNEHVARESAATHVSININAD